MKDSTVLNWFKRKSAQTSAVKNSYLANFVLHTYIPYIPYYIIAILLIEPNTKHIIQGSPNKVPATPRNSPTVEAIKQKLSNSATKKGLTTVAITILYFGSEYAWYTFF